MLAGSTVAMSNQAIKISPILILSDLPIQQPPHHFLQTIGMRENIVEGLDFVLLLLFGLMYRGLSRWNADLKISVA